MSDYFSCFQYKKSLSSAVILHILTCVKTLTLKCYFTTFTPFFSKIVFDAYCLTVKE